MIHIRAGIIYNIANSRIGKQHVSEIFYWSNDPKLVASMKIIYDILSFTDEPNYKAPVDFNYLEYFKDGKDLAKKYLAEVSINLIAYYFLEFNRFECIKNPIVQWNKNTRGHSEEKNAIFRFNNVYGYKIVPVNRGTHTIAGTNLIISGTPDGIIKSSPGGIFDDHIVEIKYQSNMSEICKQRNKYQVCSYSKIFGKPVVLIIYSGNKYLVYRYTIESLEKFWNKEILPKLSNGIKKIEQYVKISTPQDIGKYLRFMNEISI